MPFFDHFSKLRDEGNHFDIIVKQNELEIHAHKVSKWKSISGYFFVPSFHTLSTLTG